MSFLLSSENTPHYLLDSNLIAKEKFKNLQVNAGGYGKNFNLLVTLSSKQKLMVKQERHFRNGETANEFINEWQFHQLLHNFKELNQLLLTVSEAIHFDEECSILVYKYLHDYLDLSKFYAKENIFPILISSTIGRTIANIHRQTLDSHNYSKFYQFPQKSSAYIYNSILNLERLSPKIFGSVPEDCLKFFVLYQRFKSLRSAIDELTQNWLFCCVTHNDLKLNNVLLHQDWQGFLQVEKQQESLIRLIDWERSAWGDPAWDLGTLVASYLQLWLNALIADPSISIEESIKLSTTPLKIVQPSIIILIKSYLQNFPEILQRCPNFLQRVIQSAGLALIESIRAQIEHQKYFGNNSIYMLQVAKGLLCCPEKSFTTIFNMTEAELNAM
jgi:thiamine kinase-like enzyme